MDADRTVRLALAALVLGAVGIGFAPLFVRLSELGPSATAFYRFALAIPLLWVLGEVEAKRTEIRAPPSTRHTRSLLVLAGLFFAADIALWHFAIHATTVANATLLTNFAPVFVTLGAWVLFRERPTVVFALGLTLALLGAALLMGASLHVDPRHLVGDLYGLGSAFFYGAYQLTIKRVRRGTGTLKVILASTTVSAVALLVLAILTEPRLVPLTLVGWGMVVALAVVSQSLGQGFIVYGLAHLPSGFSSVTLLVQPIVAALLAWLFLGEVLGPVALLGAFVVLAGIVLARLGSGQRPRVAA